MIDAVLIGFGVIAFAVGVVIYIVQFRHGLRADASRGWPTTAGRITACALEQTAKSKRRYRASLQYRYRVGGKDYQSSRVFWGGNEGRQKQMASVVDAYPEGCSVRVRYDPENPAEAVLDPTQHTGSRPIVLYALAMMTLGLFAFTGGVFALTH